MLYDPPTVAAAVRVCARFTRSTATAFLLLAVLVMADRTEAASVSGPLPSGDGELPRLSALLWNDVGINSHVGCQTITMNLGAPHRDAPDRGVQVSLIFLSPTATDADVDRAMGPLRQEALPGAVTDRRLSELLRRWPARTSWWLGRGARSIEFEMRSLVRPHVVLTVQAPWNGTQPGAAALWGTELAFDIASRAEAREFDRLFEHWQELLKRRGSSAGTSSLVSALSEPGFGFMAVWNGASYGGPRMRSYSSRNAPRSPIGHYTISVEESAGSSEARTFLMPYSVTVQAPPGRGEEAGARLNRILERVFHRGPR